MYGYFVHNYIMKTSIVLTIGPEAKQVIAWGPSTTTARILPTRRIRYRSIRNPGEIFEDDRENEDERRKAVGYGVRSYRLGLPLYWA
jgi:hypothetical protein